MARRSGDAASTWRELGSAWAVEWLGVAVGMLDVDPEVAGAVRGVAMDLAPADERLGEMFDLLLAAGALEQADAALEAMARERAIWGPGVGEVGAEMDLLAERKRRDGKA